jgi:NADH-quinone oxidoreductase subunit J
MPNVLELSDFLFYFLGVVSLICAIGVVTNSNPIFSSLFLAGTMISVAGLFYNLGATFVAAVQLIVYAGAVMVLFVMVLMLFDLRNDGPAFSKGAVSGFLKLACVGGFAGLIIGQVWMSAEMVIGAAQPVVDAASPVTAAMVQDTTKILATQLFTKYLFSFEVIGFLLLVIAVGTVSLSRIKGGTHHVE